MRALFDILISILLAFLSQILLECEINELGDMRKYGGDKNR